jgi:threonine dehydratase/serine racemase
VGAFKFRGACNAVAQLTPDELARGVVTHSSGNHAQALALAARRFSTPAYIVMPSSAPAIKCDAVREYGGRIVPCEPTLAARESTAREVQRETGATLIHPYDDPRVIAGQGTAARELLEEVPHLDAVIAPIGGGGLMSGTCLAVRAAAPRLVEVIGAEPDGADDAARSKAAGRQLPQTDPRTIADGLLTSTGRWTWPFIRDEVSRIITVTDDEIIDAMRWVWQRAKLVIEPSAAVAVAAAFRHGCPGPSPHIGVILSGGNVDLQKACQW